jgi:hypothetical protein
MHVQELLAQAHDVMTIKRVFGPCAALACLHPPSVPPMAGVAGCAWPIGEGGLGVGRQDRLVWSS